MSNPILPFPDCNSSLNSHMAKKWCTELEVIQKRCPNVLQGDLSNFKVTRDKKIANFEQNCAFPDCNSSLNSPMAKKWCKKLELGKGRCPVVFQCHLSNVIVTRLKKSSIFTQIGRFRTVTPVCIHRWPWNDAQNLKWHRRGSLLFFKVIHQISKTRGTENCQFWPELSVSGL